MKTPLDLHEDSVHTLIPEESMFVLNGLYCFYKQEHLRNIRAQMSVVDALLASRSSEETDDRDKISALLALAHDSKRIILIPNYVLRASTNYLDATTNMIHVERRINFGAPTAKQRCWQSFSYIFEHSKRLNGYDANARK